MQERGQPGLDCTICLKQGDKQGDKRGDKRGDKWRDKLGDTWGDTWGDTRGDKPSQGQMQAGRRQVGRHGDFVKRKQGDKQEDVAGRQMGRQLVRKGGRQAVTRRGK